MQKKKNRAQAEEEGKSVVYTYYALEGLYSLSMSVSLSVDTLFLMDTGMSLFGVFLVQSAFTWGMVLFEIPTGNNNFSDNLLPLLLPSAHKEWHSSQVWLQIPKDDGNLFS